MKYRKTFAVLAVCAVAVCILTGGLFITKAGRENAESGKTEVTDSKRNIGKLGKVVSERFFAEKGWNTGKEEYLEFIGEIQAGIRDNFRTVSTEDLGICPYFMNYDGKIFTLGYEFVDLDSDGLYEMVIGENNEYKGSEEVNRIFGIYRLQDREVTPVAYASDGESYYLCDNGYIAKEKNEDSYDRYSYYAYEDGRLNLHETLMEHERAWVYGTEEMSWEDAQSIHRTEALTIKYQYLYRNFRFQDFVDKDEIMEIRAAEAAAVVWPDTDNLTFADLSGICFCHASGASSWHTELIIKPDGSFEGYYNDGVGGSGYYYRYTVYDSYFSGKFSSLKKVGPYEYSMKCESFQTEGKIGEKQIYGESLHITAEPYGFLDADEVRLYLPGKTKKDLPEEYLSWCAGELEYGILTTYGLFNVGDGSGYYVYPREESVYKVGRDADVPEKKKARSDKEVQDFIDGLREYYNPEEEVYTFANLEGAFFWSHPNGGGNSELEMRADGTFSGTCSDGLAEMKYRGKFSNLTKIGPSVYQMDCEYVEITELEGAWQFSYPYGFDYADEFVLYLREKDPQNPSGASELYNIRGDISFGVPRG